MNNGFSYKFHLQTAKSLIKDKGLDKFGPVQSFIDSECLRRCEPFTPKDSNDLIKSGTENTKIGSGLLVYNTPYARRWYYRPAHFRGAPKRGNYWFTRMKNNGGAQAIARGAQEVLNRGGK